MGGEKVSQFPILTTERFVLRQLVQGGKGMYAQIFLGIWMLVNGVCHFFEFKFLLRKSVMDILSEDELASFQKGLVFPQILLGATFIIMGIVENKGILSLPVFLGIYIILGAVSITMILINNKKHSGYYIC
jgi:uncharacterized membrane protein HdeD (DUF308 family)